MVLFLFLIGMVMVVLDFPLVDFWILRMTFDLMSFWMIAMSLRNLIFETNVKKIVMNVKLSETCFGRNFLVLWRTSCFLQGILNDTRTI